MCCLLDQFWDAPHIVLHGAAQSPELRTLLARENPSETDVRHATELLERTDSREFTEQLAREHHNQALATLEEIDLQGAAAEALQELAQMLIIRDR